MPPKLRSGPASASYLPTAYHFERQGRGQADDSAQIRRTEQASEHTSSRVIGGNDRTLEY